MNEIQNASNTVSKRPTVLSLNADKGGVGKSRLRYCDIDRWSKESEDIFMTFNYGINEVLSNIAKSEAEEKEAVKSPNETKL